MKGKIEAIPIVSNKAITIINNSKYDFFSRMELEAQNFLKFPQLEIKNLKTLQFVDIFKF